MILLQLITVKAPCPKLAEALKEAYAREAKRTDAKMSNYYKELTQHTGQNMSTITDVEFLYNTLEIEEQHGLKLPPWTQNFYNNEMREIASRSLAIFTNSIIQKRLLGGTIFMYIHLFFFTLFIKFCRIMYVIKYDKKRYNISIFFRSVVEGDFTSHGRRCN